MMGKIWLVFICWRGGCWDRIPQVGFFEMGARE